MIEAIKTDINQMEMFKDIARGNFTYPFGWSEKQQQKNFDILNGMRNDNNAEGQQNLDIHKETNHQDIPIKPQPESTTSFNKDEYVKIPDVLTRRKFLKGGVLLAGSALAGVVTSKLGIFKAFEDSKTPPETENTNNKTFGVEKIVEGGKTIVNEKNLSLSEFGLNWTPDGHIAFFTTPQGKKRYFISANVSTWMIETDGQKSLKDYISSKQLKKEQFHEVLIPTGNFDSKTDYKNGYTGITSVIQVEKDKNPMHLVATTHYEQRADKNGAGTYTASVGLVESFDGGLSWKDKGPIIKGRVHELPGKRITGAGQPAAITKDGYIHILYIEWGTGADQIYSAKMKINSDGSLGKAENITDEKGDLKPVIQVPKGQGYAALPSLSYNEELKKYLCVIETAEGFCQTTSTDLINWSEAKMILRYKDDNSAPRGQGILEGQQFLTYPTLLDESKKDDHTTGKSGVLYYGSRPFGKTVHNLKGVNVYLG